MAKMDFDLTADQQSIVTSVSGICSRFDDSYWREREQKHEFPWDFYNVFAEGGWLGMTIPEEFGGGELGILEASLMLEEIAASGAGMNGASPIHLTVFGMNPIVKHGSQEMKERYLPLVVDGSLHTCFGVTEPDAGTDTTRIKTTATRTDAGYVVTGRKVWISKALESTKILLLTRTTPREDGRKPTDGMTLLFADLDPDHCTVKPIDKMGRNAVDSNEIYIDELPVPHSDRVGEEGQGFRYLLDGLNPERILLAHEALGIGRAALSRAVAYANDRVVFDRPIGANQGISFPLAIAQAQMDAARLLARKAATLYDADQPCAKEANQAKYLCAEAGYFAADRAVQTHGGFGYATEYDVERYFREARLLRLVPIAQELVLAHLAEHVLGLPRGF